MTESPTRPAFTALVEGLPPTVPFVGPEQLERERGRPFRARIGANESGFGPSARALAAMREAASDIWQYGDSTNHALREALAGLTRVAPARIVVGEGIDSLLGLAVRLLVAPGAAVVTSAGAYPTFNYHVAGYGARLVTVPYDADHEDPDALVETATREGARMVYLSNPDNPMGTHLSHLRVEAMLEALSPDCVLVLDEAYAEFAPDSALPDLDLDDPRLIRFRTFSKAHGLAGLRVGYAVADARVAAGFDRIRNHFGVNRMAQAAALASLSDDQHLDWVRGQVALSRERIREVAATAGLNALPSATNFVAVDCGQDGTFARAVLTALAEQDVFVRMPGVAPLDRCIRISCGPPADMDLFARALPTALADARLHTAQG